MNRGGDEEDRTPDLRIANATLSQLSYVPFGTARQVMAQTLVPNIQLPMLLLLGSQLALALFDFCSDCGYTLCIGNRPLGSGLVDHMDHSSRKILDTQVRFAAFGGHAANAHVGVGGEHKLPFAYQWPPGFGVACSWGTRHSRTVTGHTGISVGCLTVGKARQRYGKTCGKNDGATNGRPAEDGWQHGSRVARVNAHGTARV